ncbi:MAG TPA: electron transfer flavoprotein subunit alpha/FixB family protein [Gemmatimonadaceae bacterium]|nr:electron transfer flavoprotein subunit alpha/FixB family protein [Gemmatimonadaceae bacterium]
MSNNILVVAEARGGDVRKVALEVVTAARLLADGLGSEVHAMVFGAPGVGSVAPKLAAVGADVVLVVEHDGLANYNAEAVGATVAAQITSGGYRAAIFGASAMGQDLAPRVGAKLRVGVAADVMSVSVDGGDIVVRHPMNTNKVIATMVLSATPALVSVRPGAVNVGVTAKAGTVQAVAPAMDPAAGRVKVTGVSLGGGAKLDLAEAPVVVSGGRGLKTAENFSLCEDLAAAFGNAAVGATRTVTDDGWRPHSDQIGQTGRQVSPDLYVAVGISGAIQHIAGMRNSKTIVAINKDKDAPIFKVADYGIVGDVLEIMPVLTAAVKAARAQH